jgi:hypothetical protein
MRGIRLIVAVAVFGVIGAGLSTGVAAQAPPAQGRGAGGGARGQNPAALQIAPSMAPAEIERLFDAYALVQAQSALDLDASAFLVFLQKFQQYQAARHKHQVDRQKLLNEINNLLKPEANIDEVTLSAKTKALDDLELQDAQDENAALAAVDLTLNVRQRARLRVFINNQERNKLELIALARQQAKKIKLPDTAPKIVPKIIK